MAGLTSTADWLNSNQGVLGVALFFATVFLGWVSGIFSALRKKPRFNIRLILGPTFCCTFLTGKKFKDYDAHQTGIALYLSISNIGSAPSSIEDIHIGYHWSLRPFSALWLRYRFGWFWLTYQAVALMDFQVAIGDTMKAYPFLIQRSHISGEKSETYLEVGRSTNGVVYFEQGESWGGCFPAIENGKVRLKVRVRDVFGSWHTAKFWVDAVTIEEAQKYNPAFGITLSELNKDQREQSDKQPASESRDETV